VTVELFAGLPVADYHRAVEWYARLLGSEPSFLPNETEAVWELAENRYVFIELRPEHAGHAMHTIFVDELDARVDGIAGRGIEPAERETYSNGVRKVTYRDPDGNEIGFGGDRPTEAPFPGARVQRLTASLRAVRRTGSFPEGWGQGGPCSSVGP
jgi:catechol 2,3-dioxygenase-like lactoylglutathione lyase family enzyme